MAPATGGGVPLASFSRRDFKEETGAWVLPIATLKGAWFTLCVAFQCNGMILKWNIYHEKEFAIAQSVRSRISDRKVWGSIPAVSNEL